MPVNAERYAEYVTRFKKPLVLSPSPVVPIWIKMLAFALVNVLPYRPAMVVFR